MLLRRAVIGLMAKWDALNCARMPGLSDLRASGAGRPSNGKSEIAAGL
jgi:hypothetical protein